LLDDKELIVDKVVLINKDPYNDNTSGEKVLYHNEPRNMKEGLAHPERDEIKKSGDAEIQQLIDQKVGVT